VRVFRNGRLIHQELCESEEQAYLVVDEWSEFDGVRCEVDDLSVRHGPGDTGGRGRLGLGPPALFGLRGRSHDVC